MKRKIIAGSAFLLTFGCFSVYCYGQQSPPALSQDNKVYPVAEHTGAKAVYVPVRTKSDLAVQRLQKREAIELQKRNDAIEYSGESIIEKPVLIKAVVSPSDVMTEKKQPVKIKEENVEMYRINQYYEKQDQVSELKKDVKQPRKKDDK